MKYRLLPTLIMLTLGSQAAMAACGAPASQVTATSTPSLDELLLNKTVCVGAPPTWHWQEEHRNGGLLFDYKQGPTHPIDPSKQVGTWQVIGDTVVYTYPNSGSFTFEVWANPDGSYSFCGVSGTPNQIDAIIRPGTGVGCEGPDIAN